MGWRKGAAEALRTLEGIAKNNSANLELFKEDLMNIARTTLSSKILQGKKDHFSKLCVDAVLKLKVCFFVSFHSNSFRFISIRLGQNGFTRNSDNQTFGKQFERFLFGRR